jgi:hypothetical protein
MFEFVQKAVENLLNKKQPINTKKSMPTVEIRIPISATERYLRMIHYFLESLQQFGGPIGRSAKCVVTVSRDEPYRDLEKEYPWISNYNVEFLWIDEDLFKKYSWHGTIFYRLKVKSEADIVILADADILVANNFDQAILDAFTYQKLFGFIAFASPFSPNKKHSHISSKIWWKKIFDEAGLVLPSLNCVHTIWGLIGNDKKHRNCPYYYNYGFIVSPRQYVEQMSQSFLSELDNIDRVLIIIFKSQIANTLCFERHGISCGTLPINYNFPLHVSDDKIRALNPDPKGENNAEDVKIFHYLGNGVFKKNDFQTIESLENALQRKDLNKTQTVFQRKLRFVHKKIMSRQK